MLFKMLSKSAKLYPDHPAVVTGTTCLTFAQLEQAVISFSTRLEQQQFGSGDPLILILPNGPDFVIATFAAAMRGCIAIPMNTSFKAQELEHYLANSKAVAVITSKALAVDHDPLPRSAGLHDGGHQKGDEARLIVEQGLGRYNRVARRARRRTSAPDGRVCRGR